MSRVTSFSSPAAALPNMNKLRSNSQGWKLFKRVTKRNSAFLPPSTSPEE